jgi:hypothetical protein
MYARLLLVALALSLVACGARESADPPPTTDPRSDPPPGGGGAAGEGGSAPAPTCMPGELASASPVYLLRLPEGCTLSTTATFPSPQIVRTAEELPSVLRCTGTAAAPELDLAAHDLVLASYSMSPAFGGSAVVDDGTTVTFVQRDRPPCPDDPMPMPMPGGTIAFLLPEGETRTYQTAACTLPRRC